MSVSDLDRLRRMVAEARGQKPPPPPSAEELMARLERSRPPAPPAGPPVPLTVKFALVAGLAAAGWGLCRMAPEFRAIEGDKTHPPLSTEMVRVPAFDQCLTARKLRADRLRPGTWYFHRGPLLVTGDLPAATHLHNEGDLVITGNAGDRSDIAVTGGHLRIDGAVGRLARLAAEIPRSCEVVDDGVGTAIGAGLLGFDAGTAILLGAASARSVCEAAPGWRAVPAISVGRHIDAGGDIRTVGAVEVGGKDVTRQVVAGRVQDPPRDKRGPAPGCG